jgi:hypothetical protein
VLWCHSVSCPFEGVQTPKFKFIQTEMFSLLLSIFREFGDNTFK